MHKKLMIALLIPLMMLPMVAFAYAHWYASLTKTVKMHVGTVEMDIKEWHVDATNTYDVDCDGIIIGDEITVENVLVDGQVVEILIKVDPIYPCWFLEFKFLIHNKGRLVVGMDSETIRWQGPFVDDPCWEPPYGDVSTPPPGFEYTNDLYLHDPGITGCPKPCLDKTHYTFHVEPTTFNLKPCECVMVKEFIHFKGEEFPEYQCHWFRLHKELKFREWIGPTWGSYGWP